MRKRALLIGRHDYWPGYTLDAILNLPYDYWPELALTCDRITEQYQKTHDELQQRQQRRGIFRRR